MHMPAVLVMLSVNLGRPANTIKINTTKWPLRSCKIPVLHDQVLKERESHQKSERGQRLPGETFNFYVLQGFAYPIQLKKYSSTEGMIL